MKRRHVPVTSIIYRLPFFFPFLRTAVSKCRWCLHELPEAPLRAIVMIGHKRLHHLSQSPKRPVSEMNLYGAFLLLLLSLAAPSPAHADVSKVGPKAGQIRNLVTFGDSYSDVGSPADGGVAWPTYAAGYGHFNLFPFAKSGATCSNNLTNRPFPSVFESQLPLYFSEVANGTLKLNPDETIYTLWIGTNDVGRASLLTGDQMLGITIVDTVSCAVNWVKALYDKGARNFVFQNVRYYICYLS